MEIEPIESECYYHVYNRGIDRQPIFIEEEHYHHFLKLCDKYIHQVADIIAYCLLPNHFHFLLYFNYDLNGVQKMQKGNNPLGNLFNSYAQWFNKKTSRTGGLFQRPFRRKRIDETDYLKRVVYYIHRNPVHHHVADLPANYAFSSYLEILEDRPTIVNKERIWEWFYGKEDFEDYHQMMFDIDYNIMY